jgi:hypothetical protein
MLDLFSAKSNKRPNLSHSGTPPNQGSDQKKVSDPFRTIFITHSPKHPPSIPREEDELSRDSNRMLIETNLKISVGQIEECFDYFKKIGEQS